MPLLTQNACTHYYRHNSEIFPGGKGVSMTFFKVILIYKFNKSESCIPFPLGTEVAPPLLISSTGSIHILSAVTVTRMVHTLELRAVIWSSAERTDTVSLEYLLSERFTCTQRNLQQNSLLSVFCETTKI